MILNNKIEAELSAGEEIKTFVSPSKWLALPGYIAITLLMLIATPFLIASVFVHDDTMSTGLGIGLTLSAVAALIWLKDYIYRVSTQLAVTNKRVILKSGWLSINITDVKMEKVESVTVHQGIIARMLKIGTISVTGSGNQRVTFRGAVEPRSIKNVISE